jgi:hypothetical protein
MHGLLPNNRNLDTHDEVILLNDYGKLMENKYWPYFEAPQNV